MIKTRPEPEPILQALSLLANARDIMAAKAHDALPGTLALSIQVTKNEATISATYVNLVGNIETHLSKMRY